MFQNKGRQIDLSRMLFSEIYKIMVNKVTFVGFRGGRRTPQSLLTFLRSCVSRVFGFVAKKQGGVAENSCHLFAELDLEQPASAIVNFVTKILMASHN